MFNNIRDGGFILSSAPSVCDIGSCVISIGTVETCLNYTTARQDTAYDYNWHISCMLDCLARNKIVEEESCHIVPPKRPWKNQTDLTDS